MSRELTEILVDINRGRPVEAELFEHVYDQLKSIARNQMRFERSDQTLQSTALVHEAYLRLSQGQNLSWENRRHFYSAAAESMRRILIDSARARGRMKRGGRDPILSLDVGSIHPSVEPNLDDVIDVNRGLQALESESAELAELVKLRFFAGLSMQEIADCLELSLSTVERRWRFARAWLIENLN
ncbi:MAG: sigma-70 family RNA polymerase sigma factor [Planctomycetota bacterium]